MTPDSASRCARGEKGIPGPLHHLLFSVQSCFEPGASRTSILMNEREKELRQQIDAVISQLKRIQRAIGGSRQPASMLELEELKILGRHYASLAEQLTHYIAREEMGPESIFKSDPD